MSSGSGLAPDTGEWLAQVEARMGALRTSVASNPRMAQPAGECSHIERVDHALRDVLERCQFVAREQLRKIQIGPVDV
jgi:hypothetical protein